MPSTTEGFGMAAIEAQAAGISTLLSTGIPQIVDVKLGLVRFLPLDDVNAWVEEIGRKRKEEEPTHEEIIAAFDKRGYNSVSMVKEIEDRYLNMICNDK